MGSKYLLLLGIVLLIVVSIWIAKRENKKKLINKKAETLVDATEDIPVSFGYKCVWFAVKSDNTAKVVEAIKLKDKIISNWESGIREAYQGSVFITPPIDGWVLVIGLGLPPGDSTESIEEVKHIANKLSTQFGEAQFFGTHRVVEYHCWLKSVDGKIQRVYSYLGEQGENIAVSGIPTDIEKKYNLINSFSEEAQNEDYWDDENLVIPDEELVMEIASVWSINPTLLDEKSGIKGLGVLGTLK